jgi:hypothetical protein
MTDAMYDAMYTQVTGESRHWVYQARAAYEHFAEFIRHLSL